MENNKPTRETIIRTIFLFVALANQVVVLFGGNALPFADDQIYEAISTAVTVAISLACWWKNQSFTEAAIEADFFLDMLKSESKYSRQSRQE